MNKVQLAEFIWHIRRTSWGVRSIVLAVLLCLGVALGWLSPTARQIQALHERIRESEKRLSERALAGLPMASSDPAEQLLAFESTFPEEPSVPQLLSQLNTILSDAGLRIAEAEYRLVDPAQSRLRNYQITMPIRGQYIKILGAALMMLHQIPNLALDNISFQRKTISDSQSEATLSMTLYLRRI